VRWSGSRTGRRTDGAGVDDRLCIIGSGGDLVIYEGTDPSDATKFAAIGTWYIGSPPVGRRCFTTGGGNVYVLTTYGVIPVNQVVQGGLDNLLTSDTQLLSQLRKIESQLNTDFATLLNTPGWELLAVPTKAMLMIARPSVSVTENIQYTFQQHTPKHGRGCWISRWSPCRAASIKSSAARAMGA
jgi:hypothetical protein